MVARLVVVVRAKYCGLSSLLLRPNMALSPCPEMVLPTAKFILLPKIFASLANKRCQIEKLIRRNVQKKAAVQIVQLGRFAQYCIECSVD